MSKSTKNSSKKMFPFNFQLSDNNSGFFLPKSRLLLSACFSVAMGDRSSFVDSTGSSGVTNKILITSGFARFRRNFNTIKLDC